MSYNLTTLFKIFLIFPTLIVLISTLSENRLCGDEKCSVIISTGITILKYESAHKDILAFNRNTAVRVYGKSLLSNLWDVEITGRRGYAPSEFIKEDRILVKKDTLIEVPALANLENNDNVPNLVQSVTDKKNDKIDLKSSQLHKPDIDEVSTTTTSPLTSDEMKNQINTDKIETNKSTELPNSSPVQKNINLVDGTLIEENDNYSSDDDFLIDDEDDDHQFHDEEYDNNYNMLANKGDESNKLKNSKTIKPNKSTELLNGATKTSDILNSNKVEEEVNEKPVETIKPNNMNNDNKNDQTEEKSLPLKIEEQDSIDNTTASNFTKNLNESEHKTDKSAENINDNSVENLDLTETKNNTVINTENMIEVIEKVPSPIKYYTLGDKIENDNTAKIESTINNMNVDQTKVKAENSEINKAADFDNKKTSNSEELINNSIKNMFPTAETLMSNKYEPEIKENDDKEIEKRTDEDIQNVESTKNNVKVDQIKPLETENNNRIAVDNIFNMKVSTSQEITENPIKDELPKAEALISNKYEPESKHNVDKKIEKMDNADNQNVESTKNNIDVDQIKPLETENSEKMKEIIENPLKDDLPKTEALISNKHERPMQNHLEENNKAQNKFPNPESLLTNKYEVETKLNDTNTNEMEQNNKESINNNVDQTIKSNIGENLIEKDKSNSGNIQLEKEEIYVKSDNVNEVETPAKNVQINDTSSTDNTLSSEELSQNREVVEEKDADKVPDVQENSKHNYIKEHDHGHHDHHSHGVPPFFKTELNHNHDLKPTNNLETHSEVTTPGYDDSQLSDIAYDTTTINPIQQPVTEYIPENKNNEEATVPLSSQSDIQNLDELEKKTVNLEDRSSENLNKNGEIQDHQLQYLSKENEGLFSIILNTVNNFISSTSSGQQNRKNEEIDDELKKILYPNKEIPSIVDNKIDNQKHVAEDGFCENIGPNSCPSGKVLKSEGIGNKNSLHCSTELDFFTSMSDKILEMFDVLVCLAISAASSILFAFGYYCICNCRKESSLISKLNIVERSLLASYKEVAIVKHDLLETRNKLSSIQDNSFGSNDMVIALKKDIVDHEETNMKLHEQITNLEKELENAAEAGLELNKIVSELLNSQNGDASIASSVEELQKQLNEQQKTIEEINTILGEKSRENSELNIFLSEQATNFQKAMEELQDKFDESETNKILLQSKFDEAQKEINENLSKNLNAKENTILSLKHELDLLQPKYNDIIKKYHDSEARVEALEECINSTKKDSKVNIKEFMDVANLKAIILAIQRERDSIKERLEGEMDARKLLDDHVKIISEEVSTLKLEYNQSEKDKLEAQTRLDVLSTYFKEKETQLQKELSVKEAMWMKQQGETTSTVERIRTIQDEIQALKSQNDSLRAEIEAQTAAHKAQISSLEIRAHETWLTSRQSERKFDEARSEAAALRRKLTALAGVPSDRLQNSVTDGITPNSLNNAPSPIHMDSPSSPPLLGALPPPPPFLPPPFMAPPPLPPHPHHFMGMPPPFMPPREMRPPPLGRLMSPPPPMQPTSNHNRYSPSILDDDDDDDDYEYEHRHPRGSGGRGGSRYTAENTRRYSPDNGRNYSPDSRYNYTTDIMSTYDTETDFSPPPSPRGFRSVGGGTSNRYDDRSTPVDSRGERNSRIGNNGNGGFKAFSPPPQQNLNKSQQISNSDIRNKSKSNKGLLSSGSEKSFDSRKSKGKMKV